MGNYWLNPCDCDSQQEYDSNRHLHQKVIQRAGAFLVMAVLYPVLLADEIIDRVEDDGKLEQTVKK
jgi:hypothetical protein|tara:strand:- start:18 stop:215 length:198 start_codon:yes stop_codon:yes gene_type:complete